MDQIDDLNTRLDAAIEAKDFTRAASIMTEMWLTFQVMVTQISSPDLEELTYLKTPVDIGNGKYLLTFMHVDGQKLKLKEKQNG